MALRPMAGVAFMVPPARRGAADSHGGVIGFRVARAGKAVAPSVHGHGPACSGIARMVDFALAPGACTLRLAGSAPATLPVLIAKSP